jgi:C-terminal processing protease CtpA/Prc
MDAPCKSITKAERMAHNKQERDNHECVMMRMRKACMCALILCMVLWLIPLSAQHSLVSPENTVIISNETDESFCKDFSIILRRARPQWIVLETSTIPQSIMESNLIIIGTLEGEYTGDIIEELLTEEEESYIRNGHHAVYEKESPWAESIIYVCTGFDRTRAKKAAEETLYSLEGEWILPPFSSVPREEARAYLSRIQYIPEDEELPMEALTIHIDSGASSQVTPEEAAKDVEYLFYLFSHGYCGYGFFSTRGDFDGAKKNILDELETASSWSSEDLSQLLHDNLTVIHDCHLRIGEHKYGDHMDFWHHENLELWKDKGRYHFLWHDVEYEVISVNGEDPVASMFPSINDRGDPIYRIGVLSSTTPQPLEITAEHDHEPLHLELALHRSNFTYFSEDIFQEQAIGGIPVVRIRSFSDHHADGIDQFLEAAHRYRGEPVLIVDIRGNGGGNEQWPKKWVTRFTGKQPSNNRYFTELTTKTTMMGRANYFHYLLDLYSEMQFYQSEMDRYTTQATFFEKNQMTAYWSGPFSEDVQKIPNDTTLIVVTNGLVASAAEGFLIYLQQVENVVVVGENTHGALVFGQMTLHRLPHSNLSVYLPISLNIPLDLELKEEKGFSPDLWIPAQHAVNYAIAAVRKGTISTKIPLSEEARQQKFIPESEWKNQLKEFFVPILLLTVLGVITIFVNRNKDEKLFFIFGLGSITIGIIMLHFDVVGGYAFLILSGLYMAIGGYKWIRK